MFRKMTKKGLLCFGMENIMKAFNDKTGLEYELLQFKNLYG